MESITKLTVLKLQASKVQRDRAVQVLTLLEEGLKLSIANYPDIKRMLDSIVEDYNLLHNEMRLYIWNKMTPKLQSLIAGNALFLKDAKVSKAFASMEERDYTVDIKFHHSTHPTSFIELRFNYAEDAFENGLPYMNEIVNREFKAEFMEAYGELI